MDGMLGYAGFSSCDHEEGEDGWKREMGKVREVGMRRMHW